VLEVLFFSPQLSLLASVHLALPLLPWLSSATLAEFTSRMALSTMLRAT
jgi:hypothetical protein